MRSDRLAPPSPGALLAVPVEVYASLMPTRKKVGAVVKTSLVLPEPLWRRAKLYGLSHHLELREIIIRALEAFLPRHKGGSR